jgi:hypothetical protein
VAWALLAELRSIGFSTYHIFIPKHSDYPFGVSFVVSWAPEALPFHRRDVFVVNWPSAIGSVSSETL